MIPPATKLPADAPKLFLSHRSSHKPIMRRLAKALAAKGIAAWIDEKEVDPYDVIRDAVRQGIWESCGLVAWWYPGTDDGIDYGAAPACHYELLTALACCREEGAHALAQRVFFAGPKAALDQIAVGRLKDALLPSLPDDPAAVTNAHLAKLATAIAAKLARDQPFGKAEATRTASGPTMIAPDPKFVGRTAELLRLHALLWGAGPGHEGAGVVCALVSGIGGEGKTALATEYARRFSRWWPGGTYRLDLRGDGGEGAVAAALDAGWRNIAAALAIDPATVDPAVLRGMVRARLGAKEQPYLWLVDDAPGGLTEEQEREILAPTSLGATLVTSRAPLAAAAETTLDLESLSLPDAARLLGKIAGRPVPVAEAAPFHKLVHGHALSLTLIGHALKHGVAAAEILAPLDPGLIARLSAIETQLGMDPARQRPVLATLLRTLDRLPTDGPARPALALLAALPAAPIPVSLLTAACQAQGGWPAASVQLDQFGLIRRRRDRHPASADDVANCDLVTLHMLLAETVRALPDFADGAAVGDLLKAADAALVADAQAIIADARHYRRDPAAPFLAPHAEARAKARLAVDDARLAGEVALARHRIGDLPAARGLEEAALAVRRRVSGPEHPATLLSMSNLAATLGAQGDLPAARELQEQVLAIRRRVLGPEHPATLISMNNLANTLRPQGDLAGARALEEEALAIRSGVLGPEHPDTLTAMNNLAATLHVQGDLPAARALQEEALAIRRRVLGPEHPDTLTSMNNLALTLQAQGDLPAARALQEEALSIRRRVLGPEHPDTLTAMNNLASTLHAQGDLPAARALEEQALAIRRRVLGPEHPATLGIAFNLVLTLIELNDRPAALTLRDNYAAAGLACPQADVRAAWEELIAHLGPPPPSA